MLAFQSKLWRHCLGSTLLSGQTKLMKQYFLNFLFFFIEHPVFFFFASFPRIIFHIFHIVWSICFIVVITDFLLISLCRLRPLFFVWDPRLFLKRRFVRGQIFLAGLILQAFFAYRAVTILHSLALSSIFRNLWVTGFLNVFSLIILSSVDLSSFLNMIWIWMWAFVTIFTSLRFSLLMGSRNCSIPSQYFIHAWFLVSWFGGLTEVAWD